MVDGAMAMGYFFMLFSADDGSESDLSAFGTYLVLPMMIDEAPRVISKSPFIKDSHG